MGFFCRLSGVLFHSKHAETAVYLLCLVSCLARHSHRWLVAIELSHLLKKKFDQKINMIEVGFFFFLCIELHSLCSRGVSDSDQKKNNPLSSLWKTFTFWHVSLYVCRLLLYMLKGTFSTTRWATICLLCKASIGCLHLHALCLLKHILVKTFRRLKPRRHNA